MWNTFVADPATTFMTVSAILRPEGSSQLPTALSWAEQAPAFALPSAEESALPYCGWCGYRPDDEDAAAAATAYADLVVQWLRLVLTYLQRSWCEGWNYVSCCLGGSSTV